MSESIYAALDLRDQHTHDCFGESISPDRQYVLCSCGAIVPQERFCADHWDPIHHGAVSYGLLFAPRSDDASDCHASGLYGDDYGMFVD